MFANYGIGFVPNGITEAIILFIKVQVNFFNSRLAFEDICCMN